jgi:hypothetical protein
MHRVAVGENVTCSFPIPVLVRSAKPRDSQRGRVTKRAAEVGQGSFRNCSLQRADDPAGIVAQEILAQFDLLEPRASITTGCETGRQIGGRICAQRHEIRGLAPFR